ncbi:MAG: LysR family transcriptional regulator [Leptolyngbyaceae cyanobacterium SM1_4_3]|nr:LysR family transcriptional regulator [Leptolyngbyaceae cyanobacterium SM1_4_3]
MRVITQMNYEQFDLNLLNIFDAVMTELNVTRAATRLNMTQPAVSNALKRLRHLLMMNCLSKFQAELAQRRKHQKFGNRFERR